MDIIASPTTVTFTTQFGAPAPALTPGEVVEAQVLQVLADGRARLAVANSVIDVLTTVPLTPGTTLRLAIKNTPDGIRFTLLDPGGGRMPLIPATDVARASPATTLSGAVATAAGSAAASSLAPAAGAAGTVGVPILDSPVPSALPSAPVVPPSPEAASAAALAAAVRSAAVRQSSLAPLFADLAAAVGSPALPDPVRLAAARVLALRVPTEDGVPAAALAEGFRRSGLFLESNLAAATPKGLASAPADDLKAALVVLRQVLKAWLVADPPAGKAAGPIPDVQNAPPLAPGAPEQALTTAPAPSTAPTASAPPPYRGAPTAAQPEAAPLVSPAMGREEIGHVLLRDTDGAVAHQTLLQAASLPDRPGHADPSGPRWLFEIPFAIGQGTTTAQFEISRDGRAAPPERVKPAWRARFSIDVEPIGPVHGQVALIGQRAAVTLWAERPESAARLRDNAGLLGDALRRAELEPDVLVRDGVPPRPRAAGAAAGHFLDRAS